MNKIEKRWLSPVIATVLLIALVLVLAVIIFLWAKSFISERIEKFPGQAIEDTCAKVSFDAVYYLDGTTPTLEVNNRGNIAIYGLSIKQKKQSGNSKMYNYNFSVDSGKSAKGVIDYSLYDSSDPTSSIIIYPVVLGTVQGKSLNKQYTCLDNGIEKNISQA